MKIAFAIYDRPDYFAGPIVNMRRLLPRLVELGHEVFALVLYDRTHPSSLEYLQKSGVRCFAGRRKRFAESNVRWFLKHLELTRPQVFVPNVFLEAYFAARWAREAGVITVGTMRADNDFHWGLVEQFVSKDSAWRLSGMMAVSTELAKSISLRTENEFPLAVNPSGVPVPVLPNASSFPPKIAYVGRLEEHQKRMSLVLSAMEASLIRCKNATAVIVGHGSCADTIRGFQQNSEVGDRIEFLGSVPEKELPQKIAGTSCILLLSEYEGTPGALMDAMANGIVPVISKIPGGVEELVQHEVTGVVVEPTPEAVAQAISTLIDDPERWHRLSLAARAVILDKYSVDQMTTNWENFASELLRQQKGVAPGVVREPFWLRLPPPHPYHANSDRRWYHFVRRLKDIGSAVRIYADRMVNAPNCA